MDKVIGHKFIYFWMGFLITIKSKLPQGLLQNNIYYGLGNICLGVDAIWAQECTSYKQKAMNKAFKDYVANFMKLFLDDFMVFSDLDTHLSKLRKCFDKCLEYGISQINVLSWCFQG